LRLLSGLLSALLAALSGLLLLLTGLLVLAALLAALIWIAHVMSSIELVCNAKGQSLLERISSIVRELSFRAPITLAAGRPDTLSGWRRALKLAQILRWLGLATPLRFAAACRDLLRMLR